MPTHPPHKPIPRNPQQASSGLLATEAFQTALALAKALALAVHCSELSPRLLLAGIVLATRQGEKPQQGAADELPKGTEELVRDLLPPGDKTIAPVSDRKLPLNAELRAMLKSPPESLSQLAARLHEVVAAAVAAEDDLFLALRRRATTCCLAHGQSAVGPEELAAAGYVSLLAGELVSRTAVSVQLAAHAAEIVALMKARNWENGSFVPATVEPLPLEEKFEQYLQRRDRGFRLADALLLGIEAGTSVLGRRSTAIHEAGHAVTSFLMQPERLILGITIKPEGDAAGVTFFQTGQFVPVWTAVQLHNELCVSLAGGLAEEIAYGSSARSMGWQSDLEQATTFAWDRIANHGLDPEFGCVRLSTLTKVSGQKAGPLFDRAQERVRVVMNQAAERTDNLLRENWSLVESVADALLEKETLSTEDTMSLFLHRGLNDWPGVCRVRSRPVERSVRFAVAPGVMATPEGPVLYAAGDAIVTGEAGECWPIAIAKFRDLYRPATGSVMGQDGLFHKTPRESLAYQLRETRTIVLNGGRGMLTGNAGDWIVDQGEGDLFVVGALVFRSYYEVL